jgi:hypothetical protein
MFDWYELFDYQEFEDSPLVSRGFNAFLEGIGFERVLITKGNLVSVLFRGVFLPIEFTGLNPYSIGNYAVFKDDSNKVWIGIKVEE